MKNKTKKIVKGTVIGVVVAGILGLGAFFANEFVGNPISKHLAEKTAKVYLAETYPNLNLVTEKCNYEFKNMEYLVAVSSPDSVDTNFYLTFDSRGNLTDDDYEWRLPINTEKRFSKAASDDIEALLIKEFGEDCDPLISLALDKGTKVTDFVEIDEPVDMDNFPFEVSVIINVYSDDRSDENIQKITNRIDKALNGKYVIHEYHINFWPDPSGPNADDNAEVISVPGKHLEKVENE